MTTPNNQPTPPLGYRLSYGEPFTLSKGVLWFAMNGWFDVPETRYGHEAYHLTFYAIPITPTVPATGGKMLKFLDENGFKVIRSNPVSDDALSIAIESEFGLSVDVYPSGVHVIVIANGPDKGVYEYTDTEDILQILKAGKGDTTNEKGGDQQQEQLLPCPFCGTPTPPMSHISTDCPDCKGENRFCGICSTTPTPDSQPVDINRLRELLAKATPGPCDPKELRARMHYWIGKEESELDAALRNEVPALIDEVERLRKDQEYRIAAMEADKSIIRDLSKQNDDLDLQLFQVDPILDKLKAERDKLREEVERLQAALDAIPST